MFISLMYEYVCIGWVLTRDWVSLATEDDPDGWQYSSNFGELFWFPSDGPGRLVRRRAWRRDFAKPV